MTINVDASNFDSTSQWDPESEPNATSPTAGNTAANAIDTPPPTADSPLSESGSFKPDFNVVSVEGSTSADVSVASAEASGEYGSVEVSALGADAEGKAEAAIGVDGTVSAEASGSASVYVAKAEAQVDLGAVTAEGEVSVGAGVEGAAEVEFDPANGDVQASVEAGGYVGVRAEGEVKAEVGAAEATAEGDIGVGLGAEVKADIGIEDGKFSLDIGASAYLGVGGGGELSLEIDVPELAGDAAEFGQGAIDVGADVIGNVGEFGGDVAAQAQQTWDAITPW
jgi:hypothetical protein